MPILFLRRYVVATVRVISQAKLTQGMYIERFGGIYAIMRYLL